MQVLRAANLRNVSLCRAVGMPPFIPNLHLPAGAMEFEIPASITEIESSMILFQS